MEYAIAGQDLTVGNATVGTFNATTIRYPLTPGSPAKNFVRLKVTQAP